MMKLHGLRIAITAILFVSAACNIPIDPEVAESSPPRDASGRLAGIETWGYQLQGIDITDLSESEFDLLVMDAFNDNGETFTTEEIGQVKASGKLVLAYLSVGEAETYRDYWNPAWIQDDSCDASLTNSAPTWLEEANPEWCGNYLIQFWHPDWQAIVMAMLDEIVAAGFDGVYLDKVDSFYTWLGEENLGAPFDNPDAPQQMAEFVAAIASHARAAHPDFIIVPQNGADIIEHLDANEQADYLSIIDGIGVEDTFFYPENGEDENAAYAPQEYVIGLLENYQQAGIPVFAIDYLTDPEKITQFYDVAYQHGYIPYAGTRDLDQLIDQP
jgi:cysteinyl-tRNA synthetase, unknown class